MLEKPLYKVFIDSGYILISVAPLLIGLPIAWYAHFIGLAVGFVYAMIRR